MKRTVGVAATLSAICFASSALGAGLQDYLKNLHLEGEPSAKAYTALSDQGFHCTLASGVDADTPRDEPVMFCVKHHSDHPFCDGELRVIVRLDWGKDHPDARSASRRDSRKLIGKCLP